MDVGQGKTCHVSIDDDKIMYGAFTQQVVLAGYSAAATTNKNVYRVRKTLLILNMSDNVIYWGGANCDATNGIPIAAGDAVTFDFTARKWIDIFIQGAAGLTVAIAEFV